MKPSTLWRVLLIGLAVAMALPSARKASSAPAPGRRLERCVAPPTAPAARDEARRLVTQIRRDLAGVESQIRRVPFIAAVESGRASLEQITAVVAEEYSIVRSDINSFTQMAARWDSPASSFFGDLAIGEQLALPLVLAFAAHVACCTYELDFWQAASDPPGSPLPVHR